MTSHQIEQEIQTKVANVAPRITPDDIEANITGEFYFTAEHGVEGAAARAQLSSRDERAADRRSVPRRLTHQQHPPRLSTMRTRRGPFPPNEPATSGLFHAPGLIMDEPGKRANAGRALTST